MSRDCAHLLLELFRDIKYREVTRAIYAICTARGTRKKRKQMNYKINNLKQIMHFAAITCWDEIIMDLDNANPKAT